ncbi:hypothetical protein CWI38_2277p0010 [Hamiltosporidium tvaerminnensis]|uniref:Uncharacterized protein n=1 Tax=Hamiltosporidium tvaerminnensis TaxID=1176355 RepID=A0A4V2JWL2_9MICR|nr:hypothetical protein CWI38_2277p0010 [Hamiltosporidium tvaerminnensis]
MSTEGAVNKILISAPERKTRREKDSVIHLKTKNYTLISNEGHTLDEPTININEESYLEEENI